MSSSTFKLSIAILLFTLINSCKKEDSVIQRRIYDSFLPMQVGNLWYANKENYTEIQDSVLIGSHLFYKFYSLIGGDAVDISYMRIDDNGKLIASDPEYPTPRIIRADFKAKLGEKFFTTGNGDDTDQEVTVTEKSDNKMSFSFDPIYHPNLKGHPFVITYIKGQGFPGNWTKLRINGVVLK
ncbi:MAG: hypothetical protein WKF66_16780 [Pedobacter sp.]